MLKNEQCQQSDREDEKQRNVNYSRWNLTQTSSTVIDENGLQSKLITVDITHNRDNNSK